MRLTRLQSELLSQLFLEKIKKEKETGEYYLTARYEHKEREKISKSTILSMKEKGLLYYYPFYKGWGLSGYGDHIRVELICGLMSVRGVLK
jgi:hypothetical protein